MQRKLPSKRVTIHDVAQHAKVSKTSVSRYFGDDRKLLSDTLQKRIANSINALDFRPDRLASSLRGRHTQLIGMIVNDITNPFTAQIIQAVETSCQQKGLTLIVCSSNGEAALEKQHLETLASYHIEGLVIHPLSQTTALEKVANEGMPIVVIDRLLPGLDANFVGLDNHQAVGLGFKHLIGQGFTRVIYLTAAIDGISSREQRARAVRHYLSSRLHPIEGELLEIKQELTDTPTLEHAIRSLAQHNEKTALFCANTPMALLALEQLQALELHERIGILTIDEERWSPLVGKGISTLAQPTKAIGTTAMSLLCKQINTPGAGKVKHFYPATLHARYSTLVAGRPHHSHIDAIA
ncbi:HTH-type transcriptional regulator KdgR [Halomonadaceae bacterium LMG 33818]|uniref:substrate-binding domain-containing protein n=1 Tax=Cernens ardua TaxID=3402176 RepID=UPI003EDBC400